MRKNQLHNIPVMERTRRELRQRSTPAEKVFWEAIRNRQLEGKKIRRQHSVSCFILDFYCAEEKLAIELDGAVHFTEVAREYDEYRTQYLNDRGIRVIRFENWEVMQDLAGVLERVRECLTSPPAPLL